MFSCYSIARYPQPCSSLVLSLVGSFAGRTHAPLRGRLGKVLKVLLLLLPLSPPSLKIFKAVLAKHTLKQEETRVRQGGDPLKRKRNLLSPDPNPKLNAADKQIDIEESEQVYYVWI